MRINTSVIIGLVTLLVGYYFQQPYLWIPLSVLFTGTVDLLTRSWVMSDKLGSVRNLSIVVKTVFGLIGVYATIGQLACFALFGYWIYI